MLEEKVISELTQRLGPGCFLEEPFTKGKQNSMYIDEKCLKQAIEFLKSSGFTHLSAITGLEVADGIELLYHLSNGNTLLTVVTKLPLDETGVHSITKVIQGATMPKKERYDNRKSKVYMFKSVLRKIFR